MTLFQDIQAVDKTSDAYRKRMEVIQPEISLLQTLNHQNVVRCYGVQESDEYGHFSPDSKKKRLF